jgi:hypothetical protein
MISMERNAMINPVATIAMIIPAILTMFHAYLKVLCIAAPC